MHHAGYIALCLSLYRQTISAVAHGHNRILQICPRCAVVHELGELRMDSVVHAAYALSYLKKLRTRIIGNLFLR